MKWIEFDLQSGDTLGVQIVLAEVTNRRFGTTEYEKIEVAQNQTVSPARNEVKVDNVLKLRIETDTERGPAPDTNRDTTSITMEVRFGGLTTKTNDARIGHRFPFIFVTNLRNPLPETVRRV